MEKITLKCPACGKGYKLNARQDGTIRCGYCGNVDKREKFIVKEIVKE